MYNTEISWGKKCTYSRAIETGTKNYKSWVSQVTIQRYYLGELCDFLRWFRLQKKA